MSNTRCELVNYLLYPLFAAVALSLALPGMNLYFATMIRVLTICRDSQ